MKRGVISTNRLGVAIRLCLSAFVLGMACAVNATLPPTNSLVMWMKPETLSLANGASVTLWTDSSGNGHDAVQLPTWNAPTYATNGINGRPAVFFGASNIDSLGVTNNVSPITQTLRLQTGLTFAVSFKTFDTSSRVQTTYWSANPLLSDNTGAYTAFTFGVSEGRGVYSHYDAGWQPIEGSYPVANTNVYPGHFLIATHNSTSGLAQLYTDGIFQGSDTISYNAFTGLNMIGNQGGGGPDHFRGHIGEVLVYSTELSASDRQQLQTYLTERWLDIPEPSTGTLLSLSGILALRRRQKRAWK